MKRIPYFAAVLGLGLLCICSPSLNAGFVDGGSVSGPGGFGSANAFVGATLAEPSLTYNSMAPLDMTLTVDSAAVYDVSEVPTFGSVHNLTGVAWSGFTWELISGPPASFMYDPSSPTFSGIDFTGTFPSVTGTATFATFSGGTLADGGFSEPAFKIAVSGPGTFVIRETPLAVPEPSALFLLTIGAIGVMGYRGRTRKTRVA